MESGTRTRRGSSALVSAAASHGARVAALLLCAVLLLSFVRAERVPALELAAGAMLALAAVRPRHAVVLVAGLAPLGTSIGLACHSALPFTEPLVLAYLTGWLLHGTIRRRETGPGSVGASPPVAALAAVVLASAVAQLIVFQVWVDFPWPFVGLVFRSLVDGRYFLDRGILRPLGDAMSWLEGLALFVSVLSLARQSPRLPRRIAAWLAAGAAGVAVLNLGALLGHAGSVAGLPGYVRNGLTSIRVSDAFPDYNAAGSFFSMTLLLPFALAAGRGLWGIPQFAASILLTIGLFLSGSRSAFIAVPFAVVVTLWLHVRRRLDPLAKRLAAVAALFLLLLPLLLLYGYRPDDPNRSVSAAIHGRIELATTAVRMFRTHPVFGVGIGRFYEVSGHYLSAEFAQVRPQENAHNNFLQILGELGGAGLGVFLWLVIATLRRGVHAVGTQTADRLLAGAVAGLFAFLLTCLAGHPLLIREVAVTFWMMLALVWTLATPASESPMRTRAWQCYPYVVVAVASVAVFVSVPFRARMELAQADLSNATIGLPSSRTDPDLRRFTTMRGRGQFFVPARQAILTLPVRCEEGRVEVRILVDGRPATQLVLESAQWRQITVAIPSRARRRFVPVEIRAQPLETPPPGRGTGAAPTLQVGSPVITPWVASDPPR